MVETPPRPYVPPTFAGAVSALAVSISLLSVSWYRCVGAADGWVDAVAAAVACLAGLALAVAACLRCNRLVRAALRWAGCAAMASALSCSLWALDLERARAALDGPASAYRFAVRGDPSFGATGASMTADVLDGDGRLVATVRLTASEAYRDGDVLSVVGRVEPLDGSDWARSRFMKGEVAGLDAKRVTSCAPSDTFNPVRELRHAVLDAIDPARSPARALTAGVVCGYAAELNRLDAADAFSATGLSHLVAVSGSHLALIAAIVRQILRITPVSRRGSSVAIAGCCVAYVVFTGCAPSAVRSAVMVCLALAAQGGNRRAHALSALCLTVMGFLVLDPGTAFDLGFQLSAASVLFITVFAPYARWLLQRAGSPLVLAGPLSVTLVSQWATLPLTLPVFGELSLVAPLANLIVGPLMTGLLAAGVAVAPVAVAGLCPDAALVLPDALANLSLFCAEALSRLPFSSIACDAGGWQAIAAYGVALVLYLWWPAPRRWQLVSALAVGAMAAAGWLVFWLRFAPPAVTVLDVGQADAILVRDGPSCVLVDAGVDERAARALARNNVYQLDAVVITHWDADHWGGLPEILQTVAVDAVYVAEGAELTAPDELEHVLSCDIMPLHTGDLLHAGAFGCRVVWPRGPVAGNENGESLVLDVRYEGSASSPRVLLTGDTELEQEREYADEVGRVDVLKLGHHGSAASVDDELLRVLDPAVAIASAGEGNTYGHPDPACVEAISRHGSTFACTIDTGDIVIEPTGTGFKVRPARGAG